MSEDHKYYKSILLEVYIDMEIFHSRINQYSKLCYDSSRIEKRETIIFQVEGIVCQRKVNGVLVRTFSY